MAATTLEVRWIVPGAVPGEVERWFGPAALIEDREDRYLLHDRPSELGLKVRDGRELDAKLFRGVAGMLQLPNARGRLERWEKWVFPLAAPTAPSGDGWISIRKLRRRRAFHRTSVTAVEHSFDDGDRPGCNIELTDLRVGDARWWTLALEAVGPQDRLELELRTSADRLFAEPPPETFDLSSSRSYAAWLGSRDPGSRPRVTMPDLGLALG